MALGVAYYSDNSIGRNTHAAEAKPVGIVVYLGGGAAAEGKTGLVMALESIGDYAWGDMDNQVNAKQVKSPADALEDFAGIANTKTMKEKGNSKAAEAVLALTPVENTTGWFIPSTGQWIAVMEFGLGDGDPRSAWINGENKAWTGLMNVVKYRENKDGRIVSQILNAALAASGAKYTEFVDDDNYWTSSEKDSNKGIRFNIGVKFYDENDKTSPEYSTFKTADNKEKKVKYKIRPFFAF